MNHEIQAPTVTQFAQRAAQAHNHDAAEAKAARTAEIIAFAAQLRAERIAAALPTQDAVAQARQALQEALQTPLTHLLGGADVDALINAYNVLDQLHDALVG